MRHSGPRENLIGKKFNKLFVINLDRMDVKAGAIWLCECDCGNLKSVVCTHLRRGKVKSCGCLRGNNSNQQNALLSYKDNAKRRNREWLLTDKEAFKLFDSNCHYCGSSPINKNSSNQSQDTYFYMGIDRKNNDLTYSIDNVLPCCRVCNYAKHKMLYEDFLKWIDSICTYRSKIYQG